jgi:hypothetical protein
MIGRGGGFKGHKRHSREHSKQRKGSQSAVHETLNQKKRKKKTRPPRTEITRNHLSRDRAKRTQTRGSITRDRNASNSTSRVTQHGTINNTQKQHTHTHTHGVGSSRHTRSAKQESMNVGTSHTRRAIRSLTCDFAIGYLVAELLDFGFCEWSARHQTLNPAIDILVLSHDDRRVCVCVCVWRCSARCVVGLKSTQVSVRGACERVRVCE